jgi:MscS family membrane protein
MSGVNSLSISGRHHHSRGTALRCQRGGWWQFSLWLALLLAQRDPAVAETVLPDKEEVIDEGLEPLPAGIDRSTPRKSWSTFLSVCRKGKWETGAYLLNLGEIVSSDRKTLGVVLVRQLCSALKETNQLSADALDDTPLGPIVEEKPLNYVVVARFDDSDDRQEVWLRRINDKTSHQHAWMVTRQSVSLIPFWYRQHVKNEVPGRPAVKVVNLGLPNPPRSWAVHDPRGLLTHFLLLTRQGDFSAAAQLLDLSDVPPAMQRAEGARLTRRLALVLKKIHPGGYGGLSNDPMGAPEKNVSFDEELVAQTTLVGSPVQLRVARYPLQEGRAVWLFSKATVSDTDALYDHYGFGWTGDFLPPIFFEVQLWGILLWQWVGLGCALIAAWLFGLLAAILSLKVLIRLAALTTWKWDDALAKNARGPLIMALGMLGFALQLPWLSLASTPHAAMIGVCKLFAILSFGWFALRVVDIAADFLFQNCQERNDDMGIAMMPVARKIIKPIIVVFVGIMALENVGMNVGGLLAGLGIGGLAIALAGKNTLENIFGSIVISFDRPFKIGDFIQVGDILGTVEDVGLRSTRIRTLNRTVVTIPNSQMADSKVENFAKRDRMRLVALLGVQYDTSLDQVRLIVDEVKRYLLAHRRVWQESFQVRFIGFGDYSLNIEVICYVTSADWGEFTGIRESILMGLGEIITRAGAQFAYPSQTILLGQDSHADRQRADEARTTVAQRRMAGELCLPDIPEAVRTRLSETPPT